MKHHEEIFIVKIITILKQISSRLTIPSPYPRRTKPYVRTRWESISRASGAHQHSRRRSSVSNTYPVDDIHQAQWMSSTGPDDIHQAGRLGWGIKLGRIKRDLCHDSLVIRLVNKNKGNLLMK